MSTQRELHIPTSESVTDRIRDTGLMLTLRNGEVQIEGTPCARFGKRMDRCTQYGHEGIFTEWHWDGVQLTVFNDRYGIYPLFFSAQGSRLVVSPSLHWITQRMDAVRLDNDAVAVFLRLWQYIGDDTPFAGIQTLPPNSKLVWRDGKVSVQQSPSLFNSERSNFLSYDDSIDAYIDHFASAMARRLPPSGEFTVPITGGRDSRHILLELHRQGSLPSECVTLLNRPPASQEDARIAGMLTQELGIKHRIIPRPDSFVDTIEEDIRLTQYCGGSHTWAPPLAKALLGRYETVYDGLAGSVLSSGFMVDKERTECFERGDLEGLALLLLSSSEKRVRRELRPEWLKEYPLDAAVNRLVLELSKHMNAPNPMMSFIFWNRTRRSVGLVPFGILSGVPVVHCPYLDHELFDFLWSINPDHYLLHPFHDDIMHRAYPDFRSIPFEDKSRKGSFNADARRYYRRATRAFARRYLLGSQLRENPLQRRYLLQRVLYDHIRPAKTSPWYVTTPVYVVQLLRAAQQCH